MRDTEIKQAGFSAEVQEANARTAQAGPLAEARASQEVIEQQTALAERAAQLTEKQLESQVRRPADAEAYRQRTLAEANRDTIKLETEAEAFKQRALAEANRDTTKLNVEAEANRRRSIADAEADATKSQAIGAAEAHKSQADAEAYAQRAVASAEAEAITVRADALTDGNQALIAANKLIEILPQLVEAAAKGIAGSNLTVLSGTDGVNQAVAGMVGQGISIYETLRNALVNMPTPTKAEPADGAAPAAGKGASLSVARKPEER
jgi:flotillin